MEVMILDPDLPPATRSQITAMLGDDDIAPESLEQAAATFEDRYPLAAQALRARAAELRDRQQLDAIRRGGSPFTVREGDIPSRLAQHYTGDGDRWREIPAANPGMKIVTANGSTQLEPWRGQILLPLSWEAWRKPLPPVVSGMAQSASEQSADKQLTQAELVLASHPTPPGANP